MADALFDATRDIHAARETLPAIEPRAASGVHATVSELALPLRRMRRSRKSALAALALAAATSVFVWRSTGPELQEANASTNVDADGGVDGRPP